MEPNSPISKDSFRKWTTIAVLAISMGGVSAADYEWTFANGDLSPALGNGIMTYADAATPGLTSFATTDGSSVPNIGGVSAAYMRVPAFTDAANGYLLELTGTGPNGGGSFVNQYTFIFDVLIPGALNWTPFFNTNPGNGNDADFYVDNVGKLGIGALGYTPNGTISPDTWYRIGFAADLASGAVSYYVDGAGVLDSTSGSPDGRFSLYSNQDPGPDVLLFNEGDSSGVYTHEILVSSVFVTDRTMSAAEFQALGGARPYGIMVVPEPGPIGLLAIGLGLSVLFAWRRRARQ